MKQKLYMSFRPMLIVIGLFIVLNGLAFLLYTNSVVLRYSQYIVPIESVESSEQALVFGGGMQPNGTQSIMQMDRVATAVALHQNDTVSRIVMTGDDGASRQNEVDAMKAQAELYGVPAPVVSTDPHGYRTYESCWRANNVYEIEEAIVISQDFHLPRIIYLCRSLGVNVVGVSANARPYGNVWATGPREILARLKAWIQVEITKPLPRIVY